MSVFYDGIGNYGIPEIIIFRYTDPLPEGKFNRS